MAFLPCLLSLWGSVREGTFPREWEIVFISRSPLGKQIAADLHRIDRHIHTTCQFHRLSRREITRRIFGVVAE